MPELVNVNHQSNQSFVGGLGHVFEKSPWVAKQTWKKRPFRSARHLHAELCATVQAAPVSRQRALIRAHPDLAGRLARQKKLTAASASEQAKAGLDRLSDGELKQFRELNAAYRKKFGFPFVICARLNAKKAILAAMKRRLRNTPKQEHAAALKEIEKIAGLRVKDYLKS